MEIKRETLIRLDSSTGLVSIITNELKDVHRLDKLCATYPHKYRFMGQTAQGARGYECASDLVRLRKPPTQKQLDTWRQAGYTNAHYLPHMNQQQGERLFSAAQTNGQ